MLEGLDFTTPASVPIAVYPPGATFGPRQMRDYEFVWLMEGDSEYRWGATTVAAPEGAVVLCRPGAEDFFRWDPQRRTRHAFFHFNVLAVPKHWPPERDWPLVRLAQEGDVLRPLFRHLLTWREKADPLLVRLSIAHLLAAYITGAVATSEPPPETLPAAVERATAHIRGKLDEDAAAAIGLAELAKVACVTPEHLCRLFKKSTGRAPLETVRLARLDRAAVLLARSNYGVKEIAELCGFASPFHFSRRFKQAFGKAPRQIREALRAGKTPPLPSLIHWQVSGNQAPRRKR
ncbi:MAG: helix-turn-helix transcriptional regulator [Planctomycetes bacterium]|nr:helix-turn-helix transcriptional regulator [Planctomycetota bacterium]